MNDLSKKIFWRKIRFVICFFAFLTICEMGIIIFNGNWFRLLKPSEVKIIHLTPEKLNENIYKSEYIIYLGNDKYIVVGVSKDYLFKYLEVHLLIQLLFFVVSFFVVIIIEKKYQKQVVQV
jgi:hypothetical protein